MIRLQDFKQIMEVKELKEVNHLLGTGWVIAKIIEDEKGILYVMGLAKNDNK